MYDDILKAVLVTIATAVAGALTSAILKWGAKNGLEVSTAQAEQLRVAVRNLSLQAEEWAAAQVKARRGVAFGTPPDKLAYVVKQAERTPELSALSAQEVKNLVHEELPKLGLGAAASPEDLDQ